MTGFIRKITHGWVSQTFASDGKCLEQDFFAGDIVEWEDFDGDEVEPKNFYHPFEMVKPLPRFPGETPPKK